MSGEQLAVDGRNAQNSAKREAIAVEKTNNGRAARRMGAVGILTLLLVAVMVFLPSPASAGTSAAGQVSVGISVGFGPPPLPVYAQPMCPGPGYIWTPGYWGYDRDDGYFWVPGTWVPAPFPGALWTPGYWGWDPAVALFVWHRGYWGLTVGFYGGINYGFGYPGRGYYGGYWDHDRFFYNRVYNRVDPRFIRHFYDRDEHHHWDERRISYNGGRGGIDARPTWRDRRAERDRRMGPIDQQSRQERLARRMPEERWSVNHGRPRIAATRRPERFMGSGVERATRAGGPYRMDHNRGERAPRQNGWHSFGGRQAGQQDHRNTERRNYQRQQRSNEGQRRFDQQRNRNAQRQYNQQHQNAGWRQTRQRPSQPAYRQQQGRGSYQRSGGNRQQQMRQRPSQPAYRQQQGRGSYQRSGGNRQQQMRQRESNRSRPAENRGGNAGRNASPKGKQDKHGNPHGGHHR